MNHGTLHHTSLALPKVVLIGGPDVDARLFLMEHLEGCFNISAFGSHPGLHSRFMAAGFAYHPYRLNRQTNPLTDLLTMAELALKLRRLKPHLVHTFDTKPGVWGRLAAWLAGVPVIVGTLPGLGSLYAENGVKTSLIRQVYQPLQKIACRLSDLTIFQNQADADQFVAAGVVAAQKSRVILGSGVSTGMFSPDSVSESTKKQLRAELGLLPDALVVTMISRVIRPKGVLEFAAAAQTIQVQYSQVSFVLIGPEDKVGGALSPEELNHLKQHVIWPGPRRDIPAVLAISDIFVLPSAYREGIPRVLLEAASMGVALVTTDTPGCNEVVEHGVNGLLVPPGDAAALSQSISTLIEQPELRRRFGQLSRRRTVERFDLAVIAAQIADAYTHLLVHKIPTLIPEAS